jgi:hypothetical protein
VVGESLPRLLFVTFSAGAPATIISVTLEAPGPRKGDTTSAAGEAAGVSLSHLLHPQSIVLSSDGGQRGSRQ